MDVLADALRECHREITGYLYMGWVRWDEMVKRVDRLGKQDDEQMWTFLVACGYAIAGEEGVAKLTRTLTGSSYRPPMSTKVWFEVSPVPPRKREGDTHLDLALGTIAVREGTEAGIRLDDAESPWICFCEMKWYADIDVKVSHDVQRNQLARVIENALCFQHSGRYADRIHVTLVTPSVFRDAVSHVPPLRSRLYQYKFEEYDKPDRASLMADLEACPLEKNRQPEQPDWFFPRDLAERAKSLLALRWVTYDELFDDKNLPDSPIAAELKDFWAKYGNYQGRP